MSLGSLELEVFNNKKLGALVVGDMISTRIKTDTEVSALRVHSGWLYTTTVRNQYGNSVHSVFIPQR